MACDACKFAVLLSGGWNDRNNDNGKAEHWQDLVANYNDLKAKGFCPENIQVFYYKGVREGRNPFTENGSVETWLLPSPHPEGVALNSPGSRSAPWEPEVRGCYFPTPKGLHKGAGGHLCNPFYEERRSVKGDVHGLSQKLPSPRTERG